MASMSEPANTSADTPGSPAAPAAPPRHYVVVARRYRPQTFDELVGQEHVAQALSQRHRHPAGGPCLLVHRGAGRGQDLGGADPGQGPELPAGPGAVPCNQCDICRSISGGDDVDVLEIDGASNRGIDEIRQLRQNVNVRPSRARFKIYIIDEVHMLTREAFNALLKTLEEPPEHVKFIFCTTEAAKIPITILSRCQRFDFAGISTRAIVERLRQIVRGRRGRGRARGPGGARPPGRRLDARQPVAAGATALVRLGADHGGRRARHVGHRRRPAAGRAGRSTWPTATRPPPWPNWTPPWPKASTWASCWSNCWAISATAWRPRPAARPRPSSTPPAAPAKQVAEAGRRLGLQTVLAAMQILDQTLARLRCSTQGRILAELAMVRLCQLEELDEIAALDRAVAVGPCRRRCRGAVARRQRPAGLTPPARSAR